MNRELIADIERAAERIRSARVIAVLTGAGISAESGVPTFRDSLTGLWAKFDPQQLATEEAFRSNPELVWAWYAERAAKVKTVAPNPGHYALVELENQAKDFLLITQNVDGLHRRAGSKNLAEIHGNILRCRCFNRCVVIEFPDVPAPPECPHCHDLMRPDVVWFGESLAESELNIALTHLDRCDLMFSIGTSGLVYPAASFPELAKNRGAFLIEINLEPTPVTEHADIFLAGRSGEILPALVSEMKKTG